MVLRSEYALGHSAFNDFLFAIIGEEKSGIQLTVLSALTRLGLDPWAEAARLSELTRESAASALEAVIARLPEGDWTASDSRVIAGRLVNRLPTHVPRPDRPSRVSEAAQRKPGSEALKWSIWIILTVIALYAVSRFYWE